MKKLYTLSTFLILFSISIISNAQVSCLGFPPVASVIASPSSLCKGSGSSNLSLVGLTDTLGLTYQWYSSTVSGTGPWTLIASNGTNATYNTGSINATTWYHVAVNCSGSITNSNSGQVNVFAVSISPATTVIDSGKSTGTLTATAVNIVGTVTYAWSPCSTLNISTGASVVATPTASTTYTVTAFDVNGCVATSTTVVNVADTSIGTTAPTTVSLGYSGSNVSNTFADVTPTTTIQTGNMTNTNYTGNNIGFTFNFNGIAYTQFGLNTNGYIWFQHDGLGAPLATTTNPLSNASANLGGTGTIDGIISVMGTFINANYDAPGTGSGYPNGDYTIGTPSIGYTLTGTAPNRILTIQWAGYSPANHDGNCAELGYLNNNRVDFQILLNENGGAKSNQIQMTYSNEGPECIDVGWNAQIGLRGTSNADFNNRSAASGNWATSTAGGTNAATCATSGGSWVKSPSFLFTPFCGGGIQTVITPSGSTNLCPAGSVTLTASSGTSYQWYLNGALTDSTNQTFSGITTAGDYVAISNSGGCGIPSYITGVTTNPAVTPSITITSNPFPLCGTSATFTATPVDTGCVPIYQWMINGVAASNAPANVTTYTNNSLTANDQVQVVMTSGALCASPATISSNIITDSLPAVAPISGGASTVCLNTATPAFTDATAGGSWSVTSGTGTASITTGGVVTGLTAGTVTVVYTYSSGICTNTAIAPVTVNALPTVAAITGTESMCINSTTQLSDATAGGTWSSGTPSVATINSSSGLVTGIAADTSVITYTVGSVGCSNAVTATVTVNALPSVPLITGTESVCVNSTTQLNDATTGGTWSSGTPSVATINSSGLVTGITGDTSVITYTVGSTGCFNTTTATVRVNALPAVAAITGTESVCVNSTTQLSDATTGGTWSSGTPSVATINSSGLVTGVAANTSVITYTTAADGNGCVSATTAIVTVNALSIAAAITGTKSVCVNSTTQLNDATTGGTWSSGTPSVATIDPSSGLVTGITVDTSVITYTIDGSNGCVSTATATVTVNALPSVASITGTDSVCVNSTTQLSDVTTGGSWNSGTQSIATVNSSTGAVTGISGGNSIITYTTAPNDNGCTASLSTTVNVNQLPIPGASSSSPVCYGKSLSLSSSGGVSYSWTGPNSFTYSKQDTIVENAIATNAGTYSVTVTNASGCTATSTTTVIVYPAVVTLVIRQDGDSLIGSTDPSYLNYQWYADTVLIPGATDAVLVVNESGNYNLQVTNSDGCELATGINVTIEGISSLAANDYFVSLVPNPATTLLTIHTSFLQHNEDVTLSIMNVLGEIVREEKLKWSDEATVNIKALPAGIYLLQMKGESGGTVVKKFIKE